jgi:hydrogenase maturation factor
MESMTQQWLEHTKHVQGDYAFIHLGFWLDGIKEKGEIQHVVHLFTQ